MHLAFRLIRAGTARFAELLWRVRARVIGDAGGAAGKLRVARSSPLVIAVSARLRDNPRSPKSSSSVTAPAS